MAVVIRMKQLGRAHRHYFRIVAIDKRQPRDGRAIEELGHWDPHSADAGRISLVPSRIKYWQSVGAIASHKVQVLINKYLAEFESKEADAAAAKVTGPTAAATPAA